MRKVITIGLFVFLTVVAGGWCVSWYVQADESKKAVEAMIAKINVQKPYLTYDSLETSGFPTHVTITLTNPRFSGRIDEILSHLDEQKTMFPDGLPQWQEDMKLDGTIKLTVSALSDQYIMEMNGKWTQNSDIAGKQVARLTVQEPITNRCSLAMEKGTFFDNMWNFKLFDSEGEEFIKRFRGIDCSSGSYAMIDTTSGAVYMSSGPTTVSITSNPQNGTNDFRVYAKYTDAEITLHGEKLIAAYVNALAPDTFYPQIYAYYGKKNLELDFSFKGPSFDKKTPDLVPFEINLVKLEISNNLYKGHGHFIMKNESNDPNRIKGSLDTKFSFEYTKHYDDLLKHVAYSFIKHASESNDPTFSDIKKSFAGHTPEQTYSMIAPAIPNLHSLGTWVQTANVTIDGNKNFTSGSVNLSDFAFTTTPYGITGSGSAKRTDGVPFPEANFTFVCSSCTVLVDDLTSYMNRVLGVAQDFYPEDPTYNYRISTDVIHGVKQLLGKLSSATPEENAKGNYSFPLVSDQTGNMTVSGKNIMEVMGLYQQTIGRHLTPAAMRGQAMHNKENVPAQGWKVE